MQQPMSDKTFVFSDAINSTYIIELYAGDYVMIEETFSDVLMEYDGFVQKINTCFRQGDSLALKSAIHKIKPLFGFVGLTDLQSNCLRFEDACLTSSCADLAGDYAVLFEKLIGAKSIIESEHARLVAFNGQ
ncbi:MAG: Hpt domain-containing protein [Bacteroidetes bacterium]|nr:Hpt domain-containing protein [Bacteroidota bacterium]